MMLLAFKPVLLAQQTAIHTEPEATHRMAHELFTKEKYGAARALFMQVKADIDDKSSELYANASLYAAICATELFNPDAQQLLLAFIDAFPAHSEQHLARFHMGNLMYRQRDYLEATRWYASLQAGDIDRRRRDEFLFKKAYSHFMIDELHHARQLLSQITDPASAYYSPASYYYGHIAYLNQDFDTAMQRFETLIDDPGFGPVVPYYIVYIHFLEKRFDELLEVAPGLLEQATPRRAPEISRLIGEAHIEKSQYEEAIPFLETFIKDHRSAATPEDHYQLGFAYFITGMFEQAIPHLERVTSGENALAQNAYYHLGYSYIQTGQKRFARNAYMQAHQMDYDHEIAREALFQYAILSFELSYDPFNEAILSFQRYITQYPDSPRREEAYGYLVDLYLTTNNYKDALASLENTTRDTPRLREAYQRVSYFRGIELFNNGDFRGAIEHFTKTQSHTENRTLVASALFWKGEAFYRLGQFDDARAAHELFLSTRGASTLPFYHRAHYTIGYTHFMQRSYTAAIPPLRRFIAATGQDARLVNDAILRIADAYFINKSYQNAMDYYNRAINLNIIDTDYAVFQKGLVYGILGNFEEKIATMRTLINSYPRSSFIDDGKYEIANSWLIINNNSEAKRYFLQIINDHPNSAYVKSAMLKTGLIHFNENEDELALEIFMEVIRRYPATTEAREALAAMRNIYVGLDRVDEYLNLTETLGIADISVAQQDSLTYQAAENRYMQGDCTSAIQSFSNYLERFPSGIFSTNANFYRSECYFRANDLERAYEGYSRVIEAPRSKFLENALLRASAIQFQRGHLESALQYYYQLEEIASFRNNLLVAREGKMRAYFQLERHADAMKAAGVVIGTDKIPPEAEQAAQLIRGKSAMALNRQDEAREALTKVKNIAENQRAAEAMYLLALITFREGSYDLAEEQIFGYVNRLSAYDFWLARTFLLLADVYLEKDNSFQAKHTLQSIIDNYEGEDIRREAMNRLKFIEELEKMESTPQDSVPIEIEFGGN